MENKHLQNLYKVFSKYSLANMFYCDCGCIDEEDVKKLAQNTILNEIGINEISNYHGSAIYTWGDISHYKYYLPRILELFSQNRHGLIDLDDILNKLEHAEWKKWDLLEKESIKSYLLEDWNIYINDEKSKIEIVDIEYYSKIFSFKILLNKWKIEKNDNSLKNFVYFYYENGNELFIKNKNDFSLFFKQKSIAKLLEKHYFKYENTECDYATKVSNVLQIIE